MSSESNRLPHEVEGRRVSRETALVRSSRSAVRIGDRSRSGGETPNAFTVAFVLNALRQWWKIAIPASLLCMAAAGGVVYWLTELKYQASAWLKIEDNQPFIAFQAGENFQRFVATQVEIMRSPLVLGPVVGRPEIATIPEVQKQLTPTEWLSRQITVTSVGQSELFRVSFTSPNPVHASRVVNAVLDSYFDLRGKEDAKQTQRVIELLEQEKERRAQEVNLLRENVRELTKQATGKDPYAYKSETKQPQNHPLTELQVRLATVEVERELLAAQVKAFEEQITKRRVEVPDTVVDRTLRSHPQVAAFDQALSAKRVRLQEYEATIAGGKSNALCRQLANEIAQDEQRREGSCRDLRKEIKADLEATALARQKEDLAEYRAKLANQELMEKLLRERCKSQVQEVQQLSGETLELEFKRAELNRAEQVFDLISSRIVKLQTEQRAPSRVMLLQQADVPPAPIELTAYRRMGLAAFAGFCFPLILVVLWERVLRRVSHAAQIEEQARLPVVGEITRLPVRFAHQSYPASKRLGRELGMFEESVDSLRTCLLFSEELRQMRVLTVTSSVKNEGKTSIAIQLAMSISRASGEPTLLVDADMRSPAIHRVLGVRREPGLVGVLGHECRLEEAIVTDWSELVHVLPAGQLRVTPHKLVGNGVLRSLIDELRGKYRYVIIDTPPILAASEALVLAQVADASLMCAMQDVSRLDQIRKAHERLLAVGSRPVGVVLNGVSARRYTYHYGRYSYSTRYGS